jgi:NADPH-dependent curcumin reductase CurA
MLKYISEFGVISLCGATSNYLNVKFILIQFKNRSGLNNYSVIISKQLTLKGFNYGQFMNQIF